MAVRLIRHLSSILFQAAHRPPQKPSISASAPSLHSADSPNATHGTKQLTPLTWLEGIPQDMSLVVYIDQASVQIMEVVAVSRKLAANLFGIPQYTGKHAVWQSVGKFNLRRRDFSPATAFQQQEDALNELESLLSARWHASTELAHLDQDILRTIERVCQPETDGDSDPSQSAPPHALTPLLELFQSRHVVSEEASRIDATVIGAFQRIGVAIPEDLPAPENINAMPQKLPLASCQQPKN